MPHADIQFTTDLTLYKGDLVLLGHDAAMGQSIRDRLATFKGEWFLDLNFGPDYRADILIKNPRLDVVSAILKDQILMSADGVFTEFEYAQDAARHSVISYTLDTTEGTLSDTITIG